LIDALNDWLDNKPELKRIFAIWIRAVLLRHSKQHLALPKVNDLKELKMALAEKFELWAKEYKQQGLVEGMEKGLEKGMEKGIERGIEKGIEKGESLALQRLLSKRFGPLTPDVVAKIGSASAGQIEIWLDRVLDAENLEQIFY
jgi:flagellar biosynthesis/type III secretory pathway protein FliH